MFVFKATSIDVSISFFVIQLSIIELFSSNSGLSVDVLRSTHGVFKIQHSSGTVQLSVNTQVAYFSKFKNFLKVKGLLCSILFSSLISNFVSISSSFG